MSGCASAALQVLWPPQSWAVVLTGLAFSCIRGTSAVQKMPWPQPYIRYMFRTCPRDMINHIIRYCLVYTLHPELPCFSSSAVSFPSSTVLLVIRALYVSFP